MLQSWQTSVVTKAGKLSKDSMVNKINCVLFSLESYKSYFSIDVGSKPEFSPEEVKREHNQAKTVEIEGERCSFVLKTADFLLSESRIGVKSAFHFPFSSFYFPLSTFNFPSKLSSSCPKNGLKQNNHPSFQ